MRPAIKQARRLLATAACACLLCACAAPAQLPAMPCVAMRPAAPVLPSVPPHGIYAQAQTLLARDKLQAAYVRQLESLLDACM